MHAKAEPPSLSLSHPFLLYGKFISVACLGPSRPLYRISLAALCVQHPRRSLGHTHTSTAMLAHEIVCLKLIIHWRPDYLKISLLLSECDHPWTGIGAGLLCQTVKFPLCKQCKPFGLNRLRTFRCRPCKLQDCEGRVVFGAQRGVCHVWQRLWVHFHLAHQGRETGAATEGRQ